MSDFRQFDRATGFLLPLSLDEWLPERHLARFVVEVIDGLDLSAMVKSYRGSGSAGYHPALLLGLLVYGYTTGVFEPQAGAGDLLVSNRGAYRQSVQTADDLTRLVRERVRQVLFREGLAVVDYFEGCNVAIESHRGRLPDWGQRPGRPRCRGPGCVRQCGGGPRSEGGNHDDPDRLRSRCGPHRDRLVSSLDHPGGNITGITSMTMGMGMGSKRLGLFDHNREKSGADAALWVVLLAALAAGAASCPNAGVAAAAANVANKRKSRWLCIAQLLLVMTPVPQVTPRGHLAARHSPSANIQRQKALIMRAEARSYQTGSAEAA
jgi:transposase